MKVAILLAFAVYLVHGSVLPQDAARCSTVNCLIENGCRCSSTNNPISNPADPAPQLIAITVSESVVENLYSTYWEPILFHQNNPDGRPISATFYINHEYTNYEIVQKLYLHGFEIGVHSITKNLSQEYWRHANFNDLVEEFGGQRQIISKFANIPIEDIVGGRTPQLQLEGDLSINAYVESGLAYDNSWPTSSTHPLLPYTLDYKSEQECLVTMTCPTESHPGFWIAPITNIKGNNSVECNSLATCLIQGTAQEIATWLISQVDHVQNGNRAPLVLRLDSYWFQFIDNSFEGFKLFLDEITQRKDVFFVSVQDVINWIKNPVPVSSFQTPHHSRSATCKPVSCKLSAEDGSERYMQSCVSCPRSYPWKGNPLGQ